MVFVDSRLDRTMKYRNVIGVVLVISLVMLCLSVPVQAQSNNDGLLYDYEVYGDITSRVGALVHSALIGTLLLAHLLETVFNLWNCSWPMMAMIHWRFTG